MAKVTLPAAVGYIRFSSDRQEGGDSVRRQREKIAAWVTANRARVVLDTSLGDGGIFLDAGMTGFAQTGEERATLNDYALGELLARVDSGRIPAGSFLVVESADRLSRESAVHALNLVTGLLKKKIVVVTLTPETELRSDADLFKLLSIGITSERAHDESRIKSTRARSNWERKRQGATQQPLTRNVPSWLRLVGARKVNGRLVGGEIKEDAQKVAVVKELFALARSGIGTRTIASRMNKNRVPVVGRGTNWSTSAVYHILTSRAVLGEYRPHTGRTGSAVKGRAETRKPTGDVVAGYYPAVIGPDEFAVVQAELRARKSQRGRRGKKVNLFSLLLTDARSGNTFTYRNSKTRPATIIPNDMPVGTAWTSFGAEVLELALLSQMAELKPADIFPSDDLGGDVVRIGALKSAKEAELAGFRAEVEADTTLLKLFKNKLRKLDAEVEELAGQLAEAQRKAASPIAEAWGEFRGVADMLAANRTDDLRLRCRTALRRLVERVYCVFAGDRRVQFAAVQVRFTGGAVRNYFIVYEQKRANGRGYSRPARWWVKSFAEAGIGDGLDLSRRADAAAVVKVLDRLDPALYMLPAAGGGKSV